MLSRDPRIREQFIDVFALDQNKYLIDGVYLCNDHIAEKSGNHWFMFQVIVKILSILQIHLQKNRGFIKFKNKSIYKDKSRRSTFSFSLYCLAFVESMQYFLVIIYAEENL